MKYLIACLLFLVSLPSLSEYSTQVIELNSRQAGDLVPVLKPFISDGGVISGIDNQLVIKTSPKNLREIRRIVERLDRPQRQLMIYVRQVTDQSTRRSANRADVELMAGRGKVIVGNPQPGNSVSYRVKRNSSTGKRDAHQSIRVLEGSPAFIATGRAIPVEESTTLTSGPIIYQQSNIRYQDATTGFYATPRLNGDRVTLQISTHQVAQGSKQEEFTTQYADTLVSGQLGEWIPVAGADSSNQQNREGILRSTTTRSEQEISIELMVEELN